MELDLPIGKPAGPAGNPGFIDSHCHLADPRLAPHLDELLALCAAEGIQGFIQGGVDPEDWDRQLELGERFAGRVFPVFGLHPWFVAAHFESGREIVEVALEQLPRYLKRAVGLGELGLDHGSRTDPASHPWQEELFVRQLEIARAHGPLPLVLHIVKAHGPALAILRRFGPFPRGGLVHSFSVSGEVARAYLELGFTLSIGGALCRRRGFETLKRAASVLPLDRVVLESDCPDQLPDGFAAKYPGLNDPRAVFRVAQALCQLRPEPRPRPEDVLAASALRLRAIFELESGSKRP